MRRNITSIKPSVFSQSSYSNQFSLKRVFLYSFLSLFLLAMLPSCKAKKQAQADKAAVEMLAAQTEQAKQDLIGLLSDNTGKTLAQKEAELQKLKDLGLKDPEVLSLINQVETKLAKERAEMEEAQKLAAEKERNGKEQIQLEARQRAINTAFANVARTGSHADINSTLELFSSGNVPVLIVISNVGGVKDYDKPTTIKLYLEHLKDTKSIEEQVSQMVYDGNGKIAQVEMVKLGIR
ncbi:MAG: hypothetical protein ACI959_000215 [Limisphaerales bacterium]|jgi:hypothetical protein